MRNLIIVALSCLAGLPCLAKEDRADEIIAKLQKKYDSVNDVTITFTEHVQFGATKIEQSFSGTLFVKKGKKYRVPKVLLSGNHADIDAWRKEKRG